MFRLHLLVHTEGKMHGNTEFWEKRVDDIPPTYLNTEPYDNVIFDLGGVNHYPKRVWYMLGDEEVDEDGWLVELLSLFVNPDEHVQGIFKNSNARTFGQSWWTDTEGDWSEHLLQAGMRKVLK